MHKVVTCAVLFILCSAICLHSQSVERPQGRPNPGNDSVQYRTVLNRYCIACHQQQVHQGGLSLDKLDLAKTQEDAATWEKVIAKLRSGAMPPAGLPRPNKATYNSFAGYLESELDRAAAQRPIPGRLTIHRLNRIEYGNAVRDLLGLDVKVDQLLPADDSGYGFDNIADLLSLSPMLLERYMNAAGKISKLALGDPDVRPAAEIYEVSHLLNQDDRMGEDLPLGTRGGLAVRHQFPVDGDYVLKIRLQKGGSRKDEEILGLTDHHQIDVRMDGQRLKVFSIGGHSPKAKPAKGKSEDEGGGEEDEADKELELHFSAKAGPHLMGVSFLGRTVVPEGPLQPTFAEFRFSNKTSSGRAAAPRLNEVGPAIWKVIVEGPFQPKQISDTPSRRKIFTCRPTSAADEMPCAKTILTDLASLAYRRPVTDRERRGLLTLYERGRADGSFETGIRTALRGMLVSPAFLFRVEQDRPDVKGDTAYPITSLELASRLSFFLWSSIPDRQLLDAAVAGTLGKSEVLEAQVRRMLLDPRSKALVTNFGGQWLYLRNLEGVHPDPEAFPHFDDSLREAFIQETELFLEDSLRQDRSIVGLLDANYTYLNERLANFYGIPDVVGSHFRRVTLKGDERRGLLGHGGILTVTSYANRTSPTVRGKWLLENFLGSPPPPPPPNIPSLTEERTTDGKFLTMRQRLETHRKNPVCASCHAQMDPLGFALENFDGVGKWRVKEGSAAIETAGVLPDGTKLNGSSDLRNVLLSKSDRFATSVTEKLLTYALGRGLEYYDAPTVRGIVRDAASTNYKWSSLILGITRSPPFLMRMNSAPSTRSMKAHGEAAKP